MSHLDSYEQISKDLDIYNIQMEEGDLLEAITERVSWYLEHNVDLLLSFLYRLDVSEQDINRVLSGSNSSNPDISLATLILERQRQRMATKKRFKVDPIDGWEF